VMRDRSSASSFVRERAKRIVGRCGGLDGDGLRDARKVPADRPRIGGIVMQIEKFGDHAVPLARARAPRTIPRRPSCRAAETRRSRRAVSAAGSARKCAYSRFEKLDAARRAEARAG
jgi:hypothetical protein